MPALLVAALTVGCDDPVEPPVEPGSRQALTIFYDALAGPSWTNNGNWSTDAPLDTWYGVTTDPEGNVTGLDLSANGLVGSIPPETAMLKELQHLDLSSNRLGSIPPELGSLRKLRFLHLYGNRFFGQRIPPELGNLENLEFLDLGLSYMSGPIPPELGNLEKLEHLLLDQNSLTGSIPFELGYLDNLKSLDLGKSGLRGLIPLELGNLRNLETLSLYWNELSGPIPPELGNLGVLEDFRVNHTALSGRLPRELTAVPLELFHWNHTELCAPADEEFQAWLVSIPNRKDNPDCDS